MFRGFNWGLGWDCVAFLSFLCFLWFVSLVCLVCLVVGFFREKEQKTVGGKVWGGVVASFAEELVFLMSVVEVFLIAVPF